MHNNSAYPRHKNEVNFRTLLTGLKGQFLPWLFKVFPLLHYSLIIYNDNFTNFLTLNESCFSPISKRSKVFELSKETSLCWSVNWTSTELLQGQRIMSISSKCVSRLFIFDDIDDLTHAWTPFLFLFLPTITSIISFTFFRNGLSVVEGMT